MARKKKVSPEQLPASTLAAVALGKRRAQLAGREGMAALGRLGAKAYWDKMSLNESALEMRRRAAVRKKNRKAKMAALLAKQ